MTDYMVLKLINVAKTGGVDWQISTNDESYKKFKTALNSPITSINTARRIAIAMLGTANPSMVRAEVLQYYPKIDKWVPVNVISYHAPRYKTRGDKNDYDREWWNIEYRARVIGFDPKTMKTWPVKDCKVNMNTGSISVSTRAREEMEIKKRGLKLGEYIFE